jgi:hypothetical protein
MTSDQRGSYILGYTRATMVVYKKTQDRKVEQISKNYPSTD